MQLSVLYVPVSHDPEVIEPVRVRSCRRPNSQRAGRFAQPDTTRCSSIQRRAFRRFCGATCASDRRSPLSEIALRARSENGRPYLCRFDRISGSAFPPAGSAFLGAWSSTHGVGVDVEDHSRELEAVELARQFFSAAEAGVVAGVGGAERLRTYYRFWSLKEAALKSIGEGLPFGLDAFEFELDPDLRIVHAPPFVGGPNRFTASVIEGTEGCAALVTRGLA